MAVYRLHPVDFSQLDGPGVVARLSRWAQVLAATDLERTRFLFRTRPKTLDDPLRRARDAQAQASHSAQIAHIRQYTGYLTRAAAGGAVVVEHYLVLPDADGANGDAEAHALVSGMGLQAQAADDLPPLLPTTYRAELRALAPTAGSHPLFSVVTSYDLSGTWDWRVLGRLLAVDFPLSLAVEMAHHTGSRAMKLLAAQQTMIEGLTQNIGARPALQKRAADYQMLLSYVQQGEGIHMVSLAALVPGANEAQLRQRERQLSARASGYAALTRYDGAQDTLFRIFFTGGKEAPDRQFQRNITSSGAAVLLGPLGIATRGDTDGILWGRSGRDTFFWDGFGPGLNQPNHWIFFGTTGSGKTGSSSALLLRELNLLGTQVIMLDPLGNCRRLVAALGARASYNPLSLDTLVLNPLEMIYANAAQQSAHLQVVLRLLLGRALSETESAAVDRSLGLIYAGIGPDTPGVNQPTLGELCRALRFGGASTPAVQADGRALGEVLFERFVQGPLSGVFNVATRADWRLQRDLIAFDFSDIPEEENLRRLAYYLVLSALERWAHRHKRQRRRIVWIDEFARLSAEPMLAARVAAMYKTFRTLGVGVWALEQDLVTFVGLDQMGGSSQIDVSAGLQILNNTTGVVALAHLAAGAAVLPQRFPQLTEAHVKLLRSLAPKENPGDRGRGLVLLGEQVHPIKIDLTPYEMQVLGGS